MSGVDHPEQRFRMLNGIDNAGKVKPGEHVKLVVD
jgi:predicted Zn-dependent protease